MNVDKLIAFQLEAAQYFDRRPTNGEDKAHWSNVYNAENCRKTVEALEELKLLKDTKAAFARMKDQNR